MIRAGPKQLAEVIHELVGCTWGRKLGTAEDSAPCMRQAVQIVVLHYSGKEVEVRLCQHHFDIVVQKTDPHEEGVDGGSTA